MAEVKTAPVEAPTRAPGTNPEAAPEFSPEIYPDEICKQQVREAASPDISP